ncbi:hypothetical protein FKM82_020493 [Ascaphus truei]
MYKFLKRQLAVINRSLKARPSGERRRQRGEQGPKNKDNSISEEREGQVRLRYDPSLQSGYTQSEIIKVRFTGVYDLAAEG